MFEIGKPDLTAETREGLPGSFVELAVGVTHYELRGDIDGRTVVLIHGNAAPYVTWDNTVEDLLNDDDADNHYQHLEEPAHTGLPLVA